MVISSSFPCTVFRVQVNKIPYWCEWEIFLNLTETVAALTFVYFSFYNSFCSMSIVKTIFRLKAIWFVLYIIGGKFSFLHTIIPVTLEKIIDIFFVSCPTKHFGMLTKWILPYHKIISALTNLSGKEDSGIIYTPYRYRTPWRENNRFCHKMPKLDYFSLAKLFAQKRRFSKRWIN